VGPAALGRQQLSPWGSLRDRALGFLLLLGCYLGQRDPRFGD